MEMKLMNKANYKQEYRILKTGDRIEKGENVTRGSNIDFRLRGNDKMGKIM
jgi:hypothetical protein